MSQIEFGIVPEVYKTRRKINLCFTVCWHIHFQSDGSGSPPPSSKLNREHCAVPPAVFAEKAAPAVPPQARPLHFRVAQGRR